MIPMPTVRDMFLPPCRQEAASGRKPHLKPVGERNQVDESLIRIVTPLPGFGVSCPVVPGAAGGPRKEAAIDRRRFLHHVWIGSALLAEAARKAAWARATAAPETPRLFDIEKVAEGVYAAIARPSFAINSNAAIIVNEDGVMVVDTHSKPSAARALIAQIREISSKPVRYVVNTHFHWDHTQGNHAYAAPPAGPGYPKAADLISSEPTREWIAREGRPRIAASLAVLPKQLEALRERLAQERDPQERARVQDWLQQGEAYLEELKKVEIELPTLTFDSRLALHQGGREIHLLFLGRGHTAGDTVVWLPQEKVVVTGDLAHGSLPYMADSYPLSWAPTLDRVKGLDFDRVIPGHGRVQQGKQRVSWFRNYVEELIQKVQQGAAAGRSLEELQKEIRPESLRTLREGGFLEQAWAERSKLIPSLPRAGDRLDTAVHPPPPAAALEETVKANVADTYKRMQVELEAGKGL